MVQWRLDIFQNVQCVSAAKTLCGLYGFDVVDRNSPVQPLDVQLENNHILYFAGWQKCQVASKTTAGTRRT